MSKFNFAVGLAFVATVVTGCSVGNAPEGLSSSEVQSEFAKQDPQKQIQGIQASPLPPEEKEKRIKEIEQKYGITRGDSVSQPPGR